MTTREVSTVEELYAAIEDRSVSVIRCKAGSTFRLSPAVWSHRSVTLDGRGATFRPDVTPPPGIYVPPTLSSRIAATIRATFRRFR